MTPGHAAWFDAAATFRLTLETVSGELQAAAQGTPVEAAVEAWLAQLADAFEDLLAALPAPPRPARTPPPRYRQREGEARMERA